MAATTAMSVQFNKVLKNKFPQVVLSPQMVINCADKSFEFTCLKDQKADMGKVLD